MFIVPLGVAWAGYLLVWYGYSMVRGPGMGIMDLASPSRVAKADATIKTWGAAKPTFAAPSFVNTPGVQPGSSLYPGPENKGKSLKPNQLGSTPPAYGGAAGNVTPKP